MFNNYLKLAMRLMKRQKFYALVNVGGLAFGMVGFILIVLYVHHEISYDGFHDRADQTYRVIRRYENLYGRAESLVGGTPSPLVPVMRREFAEVTDGARLGEVDGMFRRDDRAIAESGFFADEGFLRVFRFPLVAGDPASALTEPYSLVLTRRLAEKLFGHGDPLGRVVSFSQRMNENRMGSRNARYDLKVSGVAPDPPPNSHLQFDFLISFTTIASLLGTPAAVEDWRISQFYSYVILHPGADPRALGPRLAEYGPRFRRGDTGKYILQPLKSIHWTAVMDDVPGNRINDRKLIYILLTVALLILGVAGINVMNLAVARFSKRAKEIGLRKVVGASKAQLVRQFLGESLLFSVLAGATALLAAFLFLPLFNSLVERSVGIALLASPGVLAILLVMLLATGLFSGLYPAFYLSALQPVVNIRERMEHRAGGAWLRNGLIVLQFAFSIFLLVGMFVVSDQLRYVRSKDLGYACENVVVMPLRDETARINGDAIKAEILRDPRVLAVAGSDYTPLERNNVLSISFQNAEGEVEEFPAYATGIGYDFLDVFKLRLVQGRAFSPEFPTDVREAVIVNEAAVRKAGWTNPIGQAIDRAGTRVVGVIADFHQSSLHDQIDPMIIRPAPRDYAYLSAHLRPGDPEGALGFLKRTVEKYSPDFPFEFYFQDDYIKSKYQTDRRFGKIFGVAAGLAVLIASLGVFGLVSFAVERRTKEIAVRKVLGASVGRIVRIFSAEYLILVALACLLAWPAAWLFMNGWLQRFAFRTPVRLVTLGLAGLAAAAIALVTATVRSRGAARANPAERLRFE